MSEQWGVGNAAHSKSFDRVPVEGTTVELIHGEFPHSRSDNCVYARFPDGRIEGFNGHRLLHEITFKDENYLKTSGLSGNEVRRAGRCTIRINGHVVGDIFYRDVMEALLLARQHIQKVHNFPIRLWDPDEIATLPGRKIYYQNAPALIERYLEDQACVIIVPDGAEHLPLPPHEQEEENPDYSELDRVKEDIFSESIWWWRK